MEGERDRGRKGEEVEYMSYEVKGQEGRAIKRYEWLKQFLKKSGNVEVEIYEAEMFERFGIRPRTVARYIRHMIALNHIEIEKGIVSWIKNI